MSFALISNSPAMFYRLNLRKTWVHQAKHYLMLLCCGLKILQAIVESLNVLIILAFETAMHAYRIIIIKEKDRKIDKGHQSCRYNDIL